MPITFNPETVAAVAGILISLLFAYVPGLKDKYEALDATNKRLVMLGALLIATAGILAYTCRSDGACYAANWELAVSVFVSALVGNQSAYLIAPRPAAAVKAQ